MNHTAAMRSEYPVGTNIQVGTVGYKILDFITDNTHGEGFKVRENPSVSALYELSATADLDLTGITAIKELTGFTAAATSDIWTKTNHGLVNGMPIEFTSITGGTGSAVSTFYYVGDASVNTFKLYTNSSLASLLNISTDVTDATMTVSIWTKAGHNLTDQQSVILTSLGTGSGPTVGNQYFVKVLTINKFRLYSKQGLTDSYITEVDADLSGATIQTGNIISSAPTNMTDGDKVVFDSMDSGGGLVVGTTYYIENAVGSGESSTGYIRLYTDSGLTTLLEISSAVTNATFRLPHDVTASASSDLWSLTDHPFVDGEPLKYEGQTSGTGPVIGTTYYAKKIGDHTFELYTDEALTSLLNVTVDVVGGWVTSPAYSFREAHSVGATIFAADSVVYTRTEGTFQSMSTHNRGNYLAGKSWTKNMGVSFTPTIFSFFDNEKANLLSNSNGEYDLHKFFKTDHRLYHLRFHQNAALEQKIQILGGGGAGMGGYVELKNHNEILGFDDTDSLTDKVFALNRSNDQSNGGPVYYDALAADISYEELLMSTPRSLGGVLPDNSATLIPYKLHITGLGDGYTSKPTITEEFDRTYPGMMYLLESGGIQINTTGRLSEGLYGYTELPDWDGVPQLGNSWYNDGASYNPPGGSINGGFTGQTEYEWSGWRITGTYLENSTNLDKMIGVGTYYEGYDNYTSLETIKDRIQFVVPEVTSTGRMHENDQYNADSAARLNFENQLTEWINFDPIMPKQADIDVFLKEGSIDDIEITDRGEGYSSAPSLSFSDGLSDSNVNAAHGTATAAVSKGIDKIIFQNNGDGGLMYGTGYLAYPKIILNGGGGEGASGIALSTTGSVTGLVLTNPGSGYNVAPSISFIGGITGNGISGFATCRLPVVTSHTTFTNDAFYQYYRVVGHGGQLVNCQLNELEFYSGDNRLYDYSNRSNHTLAIKSNGELVSWGDNGYQQTAYSTGVTNALSVSAGDKHSLVLKTNGTVICFGDNAHGQCNIPNDLNNVISVSAGKDHNLALLAGGVVKSWGRNLVGQTSVPDSLKSGQSGIYGAISIAAGTDHSVALRGNGTVESWGGLSTNASPTDLSGIEAITAGKDFSLALTNLGTVTGWGSVGSAGSNVPSDLKNVVSIAARNNHALALKVDGSVETWGTIDDGTSPVSFTIPSEINSPIPENNNPATRIYAGENHGTILRSDGSVVSFGKICHDEAYAQGLVPDNFATTSCCGNIGFTTFDLGQTYTNKTSTNEFIAFRSKDVSSTLSADTYFPATGVTGVARIKVLVSGENYENSVIHTGDYPLLRLAPQITPETNESYGPTITVPNWSADSLGNLNVLYTLDGTHPVTGVGTAFSYTLSPNSGEFVLSVPTGTPPNGFNEDTTLQVYAFSDVYLNSNVLPYQKPQLNTPAINIVPSGGILNISMSIVAPTDESRTPRIYYTYDGSVPTENDYLYTNPINLQATSVSVKAKAFMIGYKSSEVQTMGYSP